MNFLSINCGTEKRSLFVKVKNKTFIQILQSDKFSNDLLMKQILDFFSQNKLNLDDISQIYVNQGPGNFSGLRGSLAVAKGVSISKNIKLFGYDNFIWACSKFLNKKKTIYSLIKFRDKYFLKIFDENLINSTNKIEEVTENEILQKYDKVFKVISKNEIKLFNEKILKLDNLNIVDLDHNELELLQLNGLLDEDLIKPVYLS